MKTKANINVTKDRNVSNDIFMINAEEIMENNNYITLIIKKKVKHKNHKKLINS